MTTYVAMIRGINVGGNALVKAQDLKKLFEDLEFENVRTYLQSGNVIFESRSKLDGISAKIRTQFEKCLGFKVEVIIRSSEELDDVIRKNPFSKKGDAKLHVIFLAEAARNPPLAEIDSAKSDGELYSVSGREVYLFLPNGYGRTKLSNNFFERKLKVSATTRNWNTVSALGELASGR